MAERGATSTALWQQVLAQFERWSALPPAQAQAELDRLQLEQPALHARLSSLIAAEARADEAGFLLGSGATRPPVSGVAPGQRLGPWTLERLAGEGGMGQVWLAQRSDGLYRGRAAVKLLQPGRGGAQADARFAREGELLARLQHPHIARLLDAGHAAGGPRWLVLEFVQGLRIDHWCDRQCLTIRARLALFMQLCQAVSFAHANLVVHRDLKPANVLVTDDAQVKLLDFGVAKLLDADPDGAELTRAGAAGLTPEYASPEQINGQPVSTASDVYALGVLLYLLLAGRRPYGHDASTPLQLAREVAECEPPPLPEASAADTNVASARSTTPAALRQALAGDLDRIVQYALRKRPEERYASVQALADDIQRHLQHLPVRAREPTLGYRAAKFVRRHRAGVMAAVLVVLAGGGGVLATLWQAAAARTEAAKASAIKDYVVGVFSAAATGDAADSGRKPEISVRELVRQSGESLLAQQLLPGAVRLELLGLLGHLNYELDNIDIGHRLEEQAMHAARTLHGADSAPALAATLAFARGLPSQNKASESQRLCLQMVQQIEQTGQTHLPTYALALMQLGILNNNDLGDLQAAAAYLERAVAAFERDHQRHGQRSAAHRWLGDTRQQLNDLDAAERHYRLALDSIDNAEGDRAVNRGQLQQVLGALQMRRGLYADAVDLLQQAVKQIEGSKGRNQMQSHQPRGLLARALHQVGRRDEGYALLAQLKALVPAEQYKGSGQILDRIDSAEAQMALDDGDAPRARAALTSTLQRVAPDSPAQGSWLVGLAEVEVADGRFAEAEALARRGMAIVARRLGADSPIADRGRIVLAEAALAQGGDRPALPALRADLARIVARAPASSADRSPAAVAQRMRAQAVLAELTVPSDPEAALRLAGAAAAALPGNSAVLREQVVLARARVAEAKALLALGRTAQARTAANQAAAVLGANQVAGSTRLAQARALLRSMPA